MALPLLMVLVLILSWAVVDGTARVAPEGSTSLWRGAAASFVVAWLFGHAALAGSGWPLVGPAFLGSVGIAVGIVVSPIGRRLATLPLEWLVAVQLVRVPAEYIRFQLLRDAEHPLTLPELWHLDGGFALTAIPMALFASRCPRPLFWVWTSLGLALAGISLLRMALTPGTLADSPWIWLPVWGALVPFATHLLTLRSPS